MSDPQPRRYRLLVDVQYPPHKQPVRAGAIVSDYPPSAVKDDLAQGWIEEVKPDPPAPKGGAA